MDIEIQTKLKLGLVEEWKRLRAKNACLAESWNCVPNQMYEISQRVIRGNKKL